MAADLTSTEIIGIHQGDIIVRTALIEAFRDLRRNPWLLEYAFAGLAQDEITRRAYGAKAVQMAKDWFVAADVPVSLDVNLRKVVFPLVTIEILSSQEDEDTLADVHYQPEEAGDLPWPALSDAFTPTSYDVSTGRMVLPAAVGDAVDVGEGMFIVDRLGGAHEVVLVDDETTVYVPVGDVADFTDAVVKGPRPSEATTIESALFREDYRIGVHVQGEPLYLLYLDAILRFCLLRYRQRLLEARGFERSTFGATEVARNEQLENELTYSRYISLTGYCRQVWPKDVVPMASTVRTRTQPIGSGNVGAADIPKGMDASDLLWQGDKDSIG